MSKQNTGNVDRSFHSIPRRKDKEKFKPTKNKELKGSGSEAEDFLKSLAPEQERVKFFNDKFQSIARSVEGHKNSFADFVGQLESNQNSLEDKKLFYTKAMHLIDKLKASRVNLSDLKLKDLSVVEGSISELVSTFNGTPSKAMKTYEQLNKELSDLGDNIHAKILEIEQLEKADHETLIAKGQEQGVADPDGVVKQAQEERAMGKAQDFLNDKVSQLKTAINLVKSVNPENFTGETIAFEPPTSWGQIMGEEKGELLSNLNKLSAKGNIDQLYSDLQVEVEEKNKAIKKYRSSIVGSVSVFDAGEEADLEQKINTAGAAVVSEFENKEKNQAVLDSLKNQLKSLEQKIKEVNGNGKLTYNRKTRKAFAMDAKKIRVKIAELEESFNAESTELQPAKMPAETLLPAEESVSEPELSNEVNNDQSETENMKLTDGFKAFNINLKELDTVDGFNNLTNAQKELVLEGLKQSLLAATEERGFDKFQAKQKEAGFVKKVLLGMTKNFQIARLEKQALVDLSQEGIELHRQNLNNLVQVVSGGPDVVDKDGEIFLNFTESESFNLAANSFAALPVEWSYQTATKQQQERYASAKKEYEAEKQTLINMNNRRQGAEKALLKQNNIDSQIALYQFINSHPDVEKELEKKASNTSWFRGIKDTITERGGYMAAGYGMRAATTSLLGVAGLPLGAMVMGGYMARRRTRQQLTEQETLARRGNLQRDSKRPKTRLEEAKNIVSVVDKKNGGLIGKLESLSLAIESAKDSDKIGPLLQELKIRLDYTQGKAEDGLVNFGNSEERLANQLKLVQTISFGRSQLAALNGNVNKGSRGGEMLEMRLQRFLGYQEGRITEAQSRLVQKNMVRGALLGGAFATVGMGLRWLWSEYNGPSSANAEHRLGKLKEATQLPPVMKVIDGDKIETEQVQLINNNTVNGSTVKNPDGSSSVKYENQSSVIKPPMVVDATAGGQAPQVEKAPAQPVGKMPIQEQTASARHQSPNLAQSGSEKIIPKTGVEAAGFDPKKNFTEDAVVHKGDGVVRIFKRQIVESPEEFGFTGNVDDKAAVEKYAAVMAPKAAAETGYWNRQTGEEVRLGTKSIGRAAYVLERSNDGKFTVHEYFNEKPGQEWFQKQEANVSGVVFEGKNHESYEYLHKGGAAKHLAEDGAQGVGQKETLPQEMQELLNENDREASELAKYPDRNIENPAIKLAQERYEELAAVVGKDETGTLLIKETEIAKVIDYRDGIQPDEKTKLLFWKANLNELKTGHQAKEFFSLTERVFAGKPRAEYSASLLKSYTGMPKELKIFPGRAVGYLKVFGKVGYGDTVREGVKEMLALGHLKDLSFRLDDTRTDGVVVARGIKLPGARNEVDVYIGQNKIGMTQPNSLFGIRWDFWKGDFGVKNDQPVLDINAKNLEKLTNDIGNINQHNDINERRFAKNNIDGLPVQEKKIEFTPNPPEERIEVKLDERPSSKSGAVMTELNQSNNDSVVNKPSGPTERAEVVSDNKAIDKQVETANPSTKKLQMTDIQRPKLGVERMKQLNFVMQGGNISGIAKLSNNEVAQYLEMRGVKVSGVEQKNLAVILDKIRSTKNTSRLEYRDSKFFSDVAILMRNLASQNETVHSEAVEKIQQLLGGNYRQTTTQFVGGAKEK